MFINDFDPYPTEYGETDGRLYRYDLDGTDKTVIVDTNMVRNQGIAADSVNKRLYWVDSFKDTLETCDYDGNGRYVSVTRSF